jgi:Putative Actinobacterial Holin-X, holin superfamily III
MADQATMRTDRPAVAPGRPGAARPAAGSSQAGGNGTGAGPGDVVTNIAEFGENLLTLAELQARLTAIELKRNVDAVKVSAAVILAGAVMAIAALPIALAGIAELLVSELGMRRGFALIAVAVAVFAVAGTCIAIAAGRLRNADFGFNLSREELARNLNWVRTVLLHSGRAAKGRRVR